MDARTPLSGGQQRYLITLRRELRVVRLSRAGLFLFFLLLWESTAQKGILDSFIFSSPSLILSAFLRMIKDGSLLTHTGVTLFETLLSFALVTVLGIGIALFLWCFPRLASVLEPYLVILNSLPKSALAPLLIVWLGSNMRTIVVAGISVAIFGAVLNLYTGFEETDPDKLKLIKTLKGTRKDALFQVVLPASVPLSFSIMKVNIGLCLIGVVIGEMIGSKEGLGYLIIYSSQVFQLTPMILAIFIFMATPVVYGISQAGVESELQLQLQPVPQPWHHWV